MDMPLPNYYSIISFSHHFSVMCAPRACHAAQLTSRHTKEPSHLSTQDHREIFTASHWPTQTYNTDRQEENIADETNSDQSRVS